MSARAPSGDPLRAAVLEALPPLPPKRATVRVIAIGEGAAAMMEGALDRWPDRVDRGLAVTADAGAVSALRRPRVAAIRAGAPHADANSVAAAEAALELVRDLTELDLALVLLSGGASSLVSLPPEGMTLADERALLGELAASGASARDVEIVRRHLSRIHGGRLAAAAAPARVLTLAASDASGGGAHEIGGGPSVPDPTTAPEARAVLERFAPGWTARAPLSESLKLHEAPRWRFRLLG